MDVCACVYHTEFGGVYGGVRQHQNENHGPSSGCFCDCATCRPASPSSSHTVFESWGWSGAVFPAQHARPDLWELSTAAARPRSHCAVKPLKHADAQDWLKLEFLCRRRSYVGLHASTDERPSPVTEDVTCEFAPRACNLMECATCGVNGGRSVKFCTKDNVELLYPAYEVVDGTPKLDTRKVPALEAIARFQECLTGKTAAGAPAVRTARKPYQAGNGFAWHHFATRFANFMHPIARLTNVPGDVVRQMDYAMAAKLHPVDGTAKSALTHGEFRAPDMLYIATGNTQYTDDDGTVVREEVSNLYTGSKKQDADMTEAARRDDVADLKARGITVNAIHEFSDNKDMEWKSGKVLDDFVDTATGNTPYIKPFQFARSCQRGCTGCDDHTPAATEWACPPSDALEYEARIATPAGYQEYIDAPAGCQCPHCEEAMPRSTLGFGEPHHGKCDCDACGGRIKAQTSRLRAAGDIMGTSARSISAGLNAQVYDPHDKVYRRSVTHDLTDANIDAVAAHRAAYMPGKYPGSKKARQVMWSDAKHAVGFRDLCCKCVPCADGRYADCDLVELTLGEPVWLPSQPRRSVVEAAAAAEAAVVVAAADAHAAVVAAVAADAAVSAMEEETVESDEETSTEEEDEVVVDEEGAQSTQLSVGDIVALTHNDPEYEDFEYYLLVVTLAPAAHSDTVVGFFLEPVTGVSGPGVYAPDRSKQANVAMVAIVLDEGSAIPRRACLERVQDGTGGLLRATLTTNEHKRLLATIPS